ncbi:MAG: hypothetical protein CMH32_07750 [Micavibrio sp.]|nr:hypothetical protein [Micavibrio sp.]HCK33353.1 hypothetical protein [Rhodospirillaceae bacterium]|tara:strand:+ start:265 stop:1125 length:861 start_codon:yes stop_codon:yes gene_type:complete
MNIKKYTSENKGPTILILGRIHGNEPIGTKIIERLMKDIDDKIIQLKNGAINLIACCNERAANEDTRFIDLNLNRIMSAQLIKENKGAYEAELALQVMEAIDNADMLIDLHSFVDPGTPPYMICIDDNAIARDMVKASGYKTILCASPFLTPANSQMTVDYAKSKGKPAVLIEAGYHNDPTAFNRGYEAVLNILATLGFIDKSIEIPSTSQDFVVMKDYILQKDGYELVFPLKSAKDINIGDPIYKTKNGDIISSKVKGEIFAKNLTPRSGEEYCYIADIFKGWPD